MKNNPINGLVSVVIPTYNRADLLKNALDSVLAQTYTNIEIIVIDDGSIDNTETAIQPYLKTEHVFYKKIKNSGKPSTVRNIGLSLAKGEWIAFLDDDDFWLSTKLELQIDILSVTGLKICTTNGLVTNNEKWNLSDCKEMYSRGNRTIRLEDLCKSNALMLSSVILHRDVLSKAGAFDESDGVVSSEDYHYWLKCALFSDVQYLDEPLVVYYDHPKSSVRAKNHPLTASINARTQFLQWAKNNNISLSARCKFNLIRRTLKEKIKRFFK